MSVKLTPYEKETIIRFNEKDDVAEVFTYNRRLITKLDKICSETPLFTYVSEHNGGRVYKCPKKYISVSKPPQRGSK